MFVSCALLTFLFINVQSAAEGAETESLCVAAFLFQRLHADSPVQMMHLLAKIWLCQMLTVRLGAFLLSAALTPFPEGARSVAAAFHKFLR